MNAMLATNDVGLHPVGYVSIGYTQVCMIGSGTSISISIFIKHVAAIRLD